MSCLPQSGSVDVCCAWTILKVNSFPSSFSVQCCLFLGNLPSVATAPLQKPRSPHSRWKRFFFWFSLAGKVTRWLASGIAAKQLGNCNGTWSNHSIFLVLSSRTVENIESWLGSIIWQNEKSLRQLVWQVLAKRVYSWNNCVFQIEVHMPLCDNWTICSVSLLGWIKCKASLHISSVGMAGRGRCNHDTETHLDTGDPYLDISRNLDFQHV